MAIEFPESTIICQQMNQVLPERVIQQVVIRDPNGTPFRWGFSNLDKVDISGQKVNQITKHGDYIFIHLDQHQIMFGDLIGKILYHKAGEKRPPKAAIVFELNDQAAFSYNPSLYGYCRANTAEEMERFLPSTWVEPLDAEFTPDYLAAAFAEPERKIAKQMNVFNVQYKAHGVCNGYWQEILYLAGVHPQRKSKEITAAEIDLLHAATIEVIQKALEFHGSSDEQDFFGIKGDYIRLMGGKLKDQLCPKCGTTITGKNILGANVYFCPRCQK